MHVGLIQVDGKLPNLALMKLSAWHKLQGDSTALLKPADVLKGSSLFDSLDKFYTATIFTKSQPISNKLSFNGVEVGGTGWSLGSQLPPEIEKLSPDYNLYNIDYGMGFTSRGCIRKCPFCIVPKKEGEIKEVCMPSELKNPKSNRLMLFDNNFLASPLWLEKCQDIIDNNLVVDFCQGLDIRLITKHNARYLAKIKHQKQIKFAFDDVKLETSVSLGVQILKDAGIKPYRLMFYVLVNYDSYIDEDLERIRFLERLGVDPFVMVYDKDHAPQKAKDLATWCNRPWFRKSCKFENYNPKTRKTKEAK